MSLLWSDAIDNVDWNELAALYHAAPLGNKHPSGLKTAFSNSLFRCFAYEGGKLVGVGRALAGRVLGESSFRNGGFVQADAPLAPVKTSIPVTWEKSRSWVTNAAAPMSSAVAN